MPLGDFTLFPGALLLKLFLRLGDPVRNVGEIGQLLLELPCGDPASAANQSFVESQGLQ
jgi:hypothetical protein